MTINARDYGVLPSASPTDNAVALQTAIAVASALPVGSLYLRSDGVAGAAFYVKESGLGSTGWIAK